MNDTYGLNEFGFNKKPFAVVQKDIENSLINSLGQINLVAPSVFSQLVSIFAGREAVLWELLEAVYNSQYPATAEDISLDGACSLTGIKRLIATKTEVLAQIKALNYTTIKAGSELLVQNTNNVFMLTNTLTVTNEACSSITIEITNNTEEVYAVIINNLRSEYSSIVNDTLASIAEGLAEAIAADHSDFNFVLDGATVAITPSNYLNPFSCFITDGIDIIDCTNNAAFIAKDGGAINVPANALNIIQTPISGWMSVNNQSAGITGRNLETDSELRSRREVSLKISGSGTLESIKARLLNVLGVTSVTIIENNTDAEVGDLPPHSFETLVLGGSDTDIANIIWQAKPAGIRTWGNTEVFILDSANNIQSISFSRSTKAYIFVEIDIETDNSFINSSLTSIKADIVASINATGLGAGVIYQSLYKVIYKQSGITEAIIKIGKTLVEAEPPILLSNNIDILPSEIAVTDSAKIVINVSP